jgi:two-component system chemotaxis response regulator CheB
MTRSAASTAKPIRVVVADDSPFVCRLLTWYLQSSSDVEVVGTALNGLRAVELVRDLAPDAVTLDLEMPELNGLEALEQIMLDCPTPVIMVSGVSRRAAAITLQALDLGAVDFVLKYTPGVDTDPESLRQEIVAKVRAASQIKVIRALRPRRAEDQRPALLPAVAVSRADRHRPEVDEAKPQPREGLPFLPGGVVVIGASTGGPLALRELLGNLPADFAAAVIVVQHIPATFTGVLAAQLNRYVSLQVKEAQEGDRLQPGLVLVAPGGYHLLLRPDARVELNQGQAIGGHRPSIDVTMQSVAQVYGSRTKGVVLTGMGSDGSLGLVSIRAKGGRTFAQDAASCVVNGMPQRAIERGVVNHVAPPAQIAQLLRLERV